MVGAVAAAVFARFGFFWTGSESMAVFEVSGSSLAWSDGIRIAELFLFPVLCDWMIGRLAGEGSLLGLGGAGKGRSSIRSFRGLRWMICLIGEAGRVCCCSIKSPILTLRKAIGTLLIRRSILDFRS